MNPLRSLSPLARFGGAAVLALSLLGGAHAEAPQAKTNPPAFYRMMLGAFEVTALSDGTVALPVDKLLTNTTPAKVNKTLAAAHLKSPLETSVNAYLINTGSKLVLIDAGAGGLFGPTLGKLLDSLKASGYQPEQVDAVVVTHMHPDHAGGLMAGDKMAFPNATVHADKREADFWLSQATLEKAPEGMKDFIKGAMASVNPYVKVGKFKPFDGNSEIVPGVRSQAARGHTPGHATFAVKSEGQKLVLWGDLMHVAAVQFGDPSVTFQYDADSKAAAAQRRSAYAEAAKQGYWVGSAHISFPGIGHVRRQGKGYEWLPVNYQPLR